MHVDAAFDGHELHLDPTDPGDSKELAIFPLLSEVFIHSFREVAVMPFPSKDFGMRSPLFVMVFLPISWIL